ncbi:MAG: ABC transporter ATP-binding protein [Deltaproteobacteria bacterium]|jgi:ABC-2 type transport system ATP-binding protein|nr:MAG: ABC transporter ATP-binding protein [Deltaproteobacteria bacterium]
MIRVQNLTKRYGERVAVNGISFEVQHGEILGFLGPNGAGKTTTMRIITGYMPPTEGKVEIDGFDIVEEPIEAKKRIGYLPENPPLYNDMTVESYLDFVADIKGVSRNEKRDNIEFTLERCGLAEVRRRLIGNLSKGFKQRVGIAQALVNNPSVLVLDEPTIGLDPKQIIEIRHLIKSLAGERTVILSTHILPEVTMICTRVVIINEGKIVLEESLERLSGKVEGAQSILLRVSRGGEDIRDRLLSIRGVVDVDEGSSGEFIVRSGDGIDIREELAKTVVESGCGLLELRPLTHTLEEVFLKVISTEGG